MAKFSPEVRERGVRLVLETEGQHASRWQVVMLIAAKIGCTAQTLNEWVKKTEDQSGRRGHPDRDGRPHEGAGTREPRTAPGERDPAQGVGVFCDGGARPPVEVMVSFIDAHRDAHAVEPICAVLPIAPCTYYDHLAKRADPARRSDRARRDAALYPKIRRVFEKNWSVYGVRKVWHQLRREGFDIPHCTVARLMKDMGLQGITREKPHRTTIPDRKQPCPLDKVNGQFRVPAPNMLWVSDFTDVATWKGFVYVAFVFDACAWRSVGWRVSTSPHAGFVLHALEQAVYERRPGTGMGWVQHSDRESAADRSIKCTERLAKAGIESSVHCVGDSYDNAFA